MQAHSVIESSMLKKMASSSYPAMT